MKPAVSTLGLGAMIAALSGTVSFAKDTYPPVDVLLNSTTTILGQEFSYPEGIAKMTGAIVTLQPGKETGWHRHNAPLFGYLLEGELSVDYGNEGTRHYVAGDALIEAFETLHNGYNSGSEAVRILVVFAGAEGTTNTVSE